VTPGDRAAAQAALNEGRGVYGRLDQIRGPEDAAADIMDLWGVVESAMRTMLGGSTLSGQDLVRELRQRGTLTLEQANALASFWDARSRVDDVGYKPTLTDVGYARAGYNDLARAVTESPSAPPSASPYAPPAAGSAAPSPRPAGAAPPVAPAPTPPAPEPDAISRRRISPVLLVGLAVLVLAVLGATAYLVVGRSSYDTDMASAVDLMRQGRVEAARAAFTKVSSEHPEEAAPHVFLARLARESGDPTSARQELATAIRLEPANERAQREMGLYLLAQNDPELARRFLVRAVSLDPNDLAAQGYLGCALLQLNRIEEGQRFISRAGQGTWSSCTAIPPPPTTTPH
jgi:tetratricopeptide (TPR) repeat protein